MSEDDFFFSKTSVLLCLLLDIPNRVFVVVVVYFFTLREVETVQCLLSDELMSS